jgi:hypothetical protein
MLALSSTRQKSQYIGDTEATRDVHPEFGRGRSHVF